MYMYIIPYGGVLVFGFEIEQKSLTISKKKNNNFKVGSNSNLLHFCRLNFESCQLWVNYQVGRVNFFLHNFMNFNVLIFCGSLPW